MIIPTINIRWLVFYCKIAPVQGGIWGDKERG